MYKKDTLEKYLNDVAARIPAPGGGSTAAMTAAMGASLISMVINFTLGKPKYAKFEDELKVVLKESEQLRQNFLRMVDLDIEAYTSKDPRAALDVPFMLARLSYEAAKLCPGLVKKGNINLVTDVAVAAILLEAAFVSASISVDINLKLVGDEKLTGAIRKELEYKERLIRKIRVETEVRVGEIIRG